MGCFLPKRPEEKEKGPAYRPFFSIFMLPVGLADVMEGKLLPFHGLVNRDFAPSRAFAALCGIQV